jgi:16S rRNA (cytosine1402-N4)-methyltransferase
MYHIPVLLEESIAGLNILPDGTYADVTFGSGQHSAAILEKLTNGRLIAFDRDKDAETNAPQNPRLLFIRQDYRFLKNFLLFNGITKIDGLLADLGISSHQIDEASRGFSIRLDGKLDMRMDQDKDHDAAYIINEYPQVELSRMFREYGEIDDTRRLVQEILKSREIQPISTTSELREIALKCAPRPKENQFLARVFQAIRIEVNEELESLKEMLLQANDLINPGGRLVVISYHSLEDRLVKNFMRTGNFEGQPVKDFFGRQITPFKTVNRKAIIPTEQETIANPRSRSAKLRIAEKV